MFNEIFMMSLYVDISRPPPIDVSDFTPPHVDPSMADLNIIQGNLGTGSLEDTAAGVSCKHENKEWYQDVGTGMFYF